MTTKKQIIDSLVITDQRVIQRRPYTCVILKTKYKEGVEVTGVGFSKVSWPDCFNELFGLDAAKTRALRDIARQILENNW